MKNIEKALILCDNNRERLAELNFVANKFTKNIDAIIFTNKQTVDIKFNRVFGINDLPLNTVDTVYSKAKYYDLILTNGYIGAAIGVILAYRLKASLVPGINGIDYSNFSFFHSVYGDKAYINYKLTRLPAVLIIKEKYFEQYIEEGVSDIEWLQETNKENEIEIVEEEKIEKEVELDKAKIVVGGGRGIGSRENFKILEKLALLLGGVVGASRAAVDNGWISHQYQIGQSGAMLAANLYLAFGISGATQHLSGIKNVKCVVAVNTDEEAAIFKRARYNIIADGKSFATELINVMEGADNG